MFTPPSRDRILWLPTKSPTPPRQQWVWQCATPYRSASWAALLGRPRIDGPRREQPQAFTTGIVIARVVRRSLGSWRDSYRPKPMEPAVSALSHGSVEHILCARGGVGMPRTAHADPSVCSKSFTTVVQNYKTQPFYPSAACVSSSRPGCESSRRSRRRRHSFPVQRLDQFG